jgi:hypothetical protein
MSYFLVCSRIAYLSLLVVKNDLLVGNNCSALFIIETFISVAGILKRLETGA